MAAAKRRVFGTVGIDMIAGPSEVLVVADGSANPDWIAADLLAQAEHDTAAQAILLTDDRALGDAVAQAVERQLATLPRRDIAEYGDGRAAEPVVQPEREHGEGDDGAEEGEDANRANI